MNTHEYQAKILLQRYGIPIPEFGVAGTVEEAQKIVHELGLQNAVLKIQVHAGGRGKGGGVKIAQNPQEIVEVAKHLIGMKLVNQQTGPLGVTAHQILITSLKEIAKEYYLGAIIDRENARAILIASPEGGMEIEEIAEKSPEKILKIPIELNGLVRPFHLIQLANFMGWKGQQKKSGMAICANVAKAFTELDASLLEINPLIATPDGALFAIDAKLSVDDNALFRQKEVANFYDATQVPSGEVEATAHDLAYIALDGSIGCMVNGAGLAMATMDIIHHFGGAPANFLDVGGSADKEKVATGFKIILKDPNVKGILVNIFGGIMNCATIAEGIIAATKELKVQVPLVVRLEGTNVEEGKRLIENSRLPIISAADLATAAQKIVESSKGR